MSAETGPATAGGPDEPSGASGCPPTGVRRPPPARWCGRCWPRRDLDELLNEALLLTTELSTNAVVHAGTELDIEVVADRDRADRDRLRLRRRAGATS